MTPSQHAKVLEALERAFDQTCSVGRPKDWESIREALSIMRAEGVGWQPIETCPLDTMVIFGPTKRMSGPCIGMHHSRDGWVTETPSEWASIYPPKAWMPIDLPAPPTEHEVKP